MATYITARITTDARKLWSCRNFTRIVPARHRGKLPIEAGRTIRLILPAVRPSPFCQARRAWAVSSADAKGFPNYAEHDLGLVCEHQVDLDERRPS